MNSQERKLHFGNLNFNTESEQLHAAITAAGFQVKEAKIFIDRITTRSRGFAFVTLVNPEDLDAAVEALNGMTLDNRKLRVSIAKPPQERDTVQQEA